MHDKFCILELDEVNWSCSLINYGFVWLGNLISLDGRSSYNGRPILKTGFTASSHISFSKFIAWSHAHLAVVISIASFNIYHQIFPLPSSIFTTKPFSLMDLFAIHTQNTSFKKRNSLCIIHNTYKLKGLYGSCGFILIRLVFYAEEMQVGLAGQLSFWDLLLE